MKIRVFSDIHWEHDMNIKMKTNPEHRFWEPVPLEDDKDTTLILAGDLWNGEKSIDQIQEFHKRFLRVIVVFGNHDFWNNNHTLLYSLYKQELEFRGMNNVFLLNRDSLTFGDDIFVGCTLWTDMDSYNPYAIINAPQIMYPDFKYIKISEEFDTETYMFTRKYMNQDYWLNQNKLDFDYIKHVTKNNKNKNIHIITHYGCSARSIHQRFKEYGLSNYFFVNEYDEFIESNGNIKTWIHGHVHNKFNYHIGNCNVITNPRGYPNENDEFDEISLYEI